MQTPAARTRVEAAALAVVALTAVAFLLASSGRITARYGDSDYGINAAVWSTGARALRDLGPLTSHLGGRREDTSRYATHPPTIVVATAGAQAIAGDHPWSSRAPAWLATVVALVLLYRLGRAAGFGAVAAAAAVATVGLTPMIVVYGSMLDTPMVALPFGLVVLGLWYRTWIDLDRRPRTGWIVAAGALAGLAGWQAGVLTGLCAMSLAFRAVRGRGGPSWRPLRTAALAFGSGGAIGVGLSLAWSWWVYGDLATLVTKFNGRTGTTSGIGFGDMVSFQVPWLFSLLGLSVVGLAGCFWALRDTRVRPVAAMALASVAVYAVIFRQAAAGHQYWNYWAVLPAAIGWGYLLDLLARGLHRPGARGDRGGIAAIAVVVAATAVWGLVGPNRAARFITEGQQAADLVAATAFPPGQGTLPYVGQPYRPDAWISYNTPMTPVAITSTSQMQTIAERDPGTLVLVLGSCDAGDPSFAFCSAATSTGTTPSPGGARTPPRIVRAARLVAHLAGVGS